MAPCTISPNVRPLDVQERANISAAVDEIIAKESRIDTLVNNARAGYLRSTEHATEDDIAWVMDVNVMGVVRCTKAVMPHGGHGRLYHPELWHQFHNGLTRWHRLRICQLGPETDRGLWQHVG